MDKNIQTIQKSTNEELTITEKQMGDYKEIFQKESLQKKKQYLLAIKQHNRSLIDKVKQFNDKVNLQINTIVKKIVPKKKAIIPKFQEIETKVLRQKFQELEKYKKQVEAKRSSTDSLQFLLTVKKKFEIKLNELTKEIFAKKKQIHQLKKIKDKSLNSDDNQKNQLTKLGDLDIYSSEIEQLRMRVRQKSDNLRAKKQQFLSLYKQNRSNKTIILQGSPKEQQIKQEDPQLLKLKQQYEVLGRRVEILKLQKSNLANQVKADCENIKKLQKLKAKYESISKVPV